MNQKVFHLKKEFNLVTDVCVCQLNLPLNSIQFSDAQVSRTFIWKTSRKCVFHFIKHSTFWITLNCNLLSSHIWRNDLAVCFWTQKAKRALAENSFDFLFLFFLSSVNKRFSFSFFFCCSFFFIFKFFIYMFSTRIFKLSKESVKTHGGAYEKLKFLSCFVNFLCLIFENKNCTADAWKKTKTFHIKISFQFCRRQRADTQRTNITF